MTIALPTILFGPQAAGRGYQALASSDLPPLHLREQELVRSIPLALAGWADQGETGFIARIPLGERLFPAMFVRARFVGEASGGTVAYAHGVIVTEAAAAAIPGWLDRLTDSLPVPDGSPDFASAPLLIDQLEDVVAAGPGWEGFGLGWQDRLVTVPPNLPADIDVETVLYRALASVTPVEQQARVRGWATTAALLPTRAFSPARAFQLVVIDERSARPALQHLDAVATPDGFSGERIAPPPTWIAWQRFLELTRDHPDLTAAVDRIVWTPQSATMAPDALITLAMSAVLGALAGAPRAQLDLAATIAHDSRTPHFPEIARTALKTQGETAPLPEAVALVLAWQKLDDAARALLPMIDIALVRRADFAGADQQHLADLLDGGLLATLTELEGAGGLIPTLDASARALVLGALVEENDWSADHALLTSEMLRSIADAGLQGADELAIVFFPVALGRCLDWTDIVPVRTNLVAPSMIPAIAASAPNLTARYAARLLRLDDAVRQGAPAQFTIAETALAWVRAFDGGARHAAL